MKKTIALLLALMMALVCTAALATAPETDADVTPPLNQHVTSTNTVTITKTYSVSGENAVNPADTLKFDIKGDHVENATNNKMDIPEASIADVTVNEGDPSATISILLPTYTTVGEYFYNITETDTGVAGVTYLTDTIVMKVQVFQGENGLDKYVTFRLADKKVDSFTNKYEAGTLTVSKTVTGTMGDVNKEWSFTVVFTAPEGDTVVGNITTSAQNGATAPATIEAGDGGWSGTTTKTSTFKLVSGQSVKFSNIPKGVTYVITETEANADGYVTTIQGNDGSISGSEDDVAAFTNKKDVNIDTGVALDFVPYALIMVLALAGVALRIYRRREDY